MIPKISLTAAFFLMVAPPMACASNRAAATPAPVTCRAYQSPASMLVAQDSQSDSDNDNDNDSNDSSDDNQNGGGNQMDQQNAAGDEQTLPPTVLNGPDNDADNPPQYNPPAPQQYNPYQ